MSEFRREKFNHCRGTGGPEALSTLPMPADVTTVRALMLRG